MKSRRSSHHSRAEGFTLIELLVALSVAGIMLGSAVQFVKVQTTTARRHVSAIESEQASRSSLDAMTRDLRLAGACLPTDGQFIALESTDDAAGDSITIRTGLVENRACVDTSLSALAPANTSTVTVSSTQGFKAGTLGYIRHPNGGGQILPIMSAQDTTITLGGALVQNYPIGSGVYALDERVYALDRSGPVPMLTLTVNRGNPQPFAAGMNDLQIRYVLSRNCPPCDQVDLPVDTTEWRLVNNVVLTTTVEAVRPSGYGYAVAASAYDAQPPLIASSTAKPRNLLQ